MIAKKNYEYLTLLYPKWLYPDCYRCKVVELSQADVSDKVGVHIRKSHHCFSFVPPFKEKGSDINVETESEMGSTKISSPLASLAHPNGRIMFKSFHC